METAGRRDSVCNDSWELQNSSPTPTIGALSPVELKPAAIDTYTDTDTDYIA